MFLVSVSAALGHSVDHFALVPADDEVLQLDRVVVERVVGVHDLVGRPRGLLLHLQPAGEELVALEFLVKSSLTMILSPSTAPFSSPQWGTQTGELSIVRLNESVGSIISQIKTMHP